MNVWILAARPKTLWASVAPVLIGTAMAYADEAGHAMSALTALVTALLIQVATNFCNDYADFKKGADTEERTGPLRATQAGLVTPEVMLRATILVFVLAALGCAYLVVRGGWPIIAIGALAILSGIAYTAGPRPLGYMGLGDLFVLVFFGPVAVGGTYYVQVLEVPVYVIIAGISPGLLSVAILTINNLRDIEVDAKAGKRTLAVRFGASFAKLEYGVCVVGSAIMPIILHIGFNGSRYVLAACLVLPAAIPGFRKVFLGAAGRELNPVLGYTARLLLLYSVLFSVGCLL